MATVHVTLLHGDTNTTEAKVYDELDQVLMHDDTFVQANLLEVGQLVAGPTGPGGLDGREITAIHFPEG
jgi:hypothetical protein